FSEYVQTVSPHFEDSLAPDSVLTILRMACAVSLSPRQHDWWNASSRYAPIAIAQNAAQNAKAIFELSAIKCLTESNALFPSTNSRHKSTRHAIRRIT